MNRRELIGVIAGAAARPLAVRAQQEVRPVIGFLSSNMPEVPAGEVGAFLDGLSEAGFADGRNVVIDYRFAEGQYDRLPVFAAELVRRHVNVIYAAALPAALAAKAATSAIPIVFNVGVDPVATGLVDSIPRPSSNLTGVSQQFVALGEKQLQLLHDLVPDVDSVGLLLNPKNPNAEPLERYVQSAAQRLALQITVFPISSKDDIEPAFATGRRKAIGAFVIGTDPFLRANCGLLVDLAARYSVPTVYGDAACVGAGGLIAYGSRGREMRRQAGAYVGRILKGARPADLPIVQPTQFELSINLKTAKALGLTVPLSLLGRADEVIE